MFPIVLNFHKLPLALVGQGKALTKRLAQLQEELGDYAVFCPEPSDELRALAGEQLQTRLPDASEWSQFRVAMIVGLEEETNEQLATQARKAGLLTHVEDVPELCDFYAMSRVQRGDLQIAISTAGKSPGLSVMLREYLEYRMGEEWTERLNTLGDVRQQWRAEGLTMPQVLAKTKAYILDKGWLPATPTEDTRTAVSRPQPLVSVSESNAPALRHQSEPSRVNGDTQ